MLKDLLKFAPLYNSFSNLIGGRSRDVLAQRYIRAKPGDSILDIGCGSSAILAFLPDVRYIGIDPNPRYIADARRRFGTRGEFHCGLSADLSLPPNEKFDLVLALGVLHHVDDGEALSILRFARSVLKPSGRFFSVDGCFVPSQPALARWLLNRDRGHHVRSEPAYRTLVESVFSSVEIEIQHRLLRIPYTHILMQGSELQATS